MANTSKGGARMPTTAKGYPVSSGYMGLVNGVYMLFACETDYIEYLEAHESDNDSDTE